MMRYAERFRPSASLGFVDLLTKSKYRKAPIWKRNCCYCIIIIIVHDLNTNWNWRINTKNIALSYFIRLISPHFSHVSVYQTVLNYEISELFTSMFTIASRNFESDIFCSEWESWLCLSIRWKSQVAVGIPLSHRKARDPNSPLAFRACDTSVSPLQNNFGQPK